MRQWLESLEEFAVEVIFGHRKGWRASFLRKMLYGLSWIFRGIVKARLYLHEHGWLKRHPLGCAVISVGNITVGGTGKTPVVEMLARALKEAGREVAILSRGYKSEDPNAEKKTRRARRHLPPRVVSDGKDLLLDSRLAGDEPYMLARNLRSVPVIVDKDRVKCGRFAVANFGSDALILDDGLQYLKLPHRLDVVLVDREAPFGNGYLLPRGTLREPPSSLARADVILLTKCEGPGNEALIAKLRRYNAFADIIECSHKPLWLQEVAGPGRVGLEYLKDRYIAAVSGIAAPGSFERFLSERGAKIEFSRRFADHHRYTIEEFNTFVTRCIRRDVDAIITTEKDAVRLPEGIDPAVPIYFLRMEVEILSEEGRAAWDRLIARVCRPILHELPPVLV